MYISYLVLLIYELYANIKVLLIVICLCQSLPNTMKNLHDLVTLKIDHNCLKQMDSIFEGLQRLEELDASYNFLETLSPTVGLMRKLITLRLDANRLNSIPTGISYQY